jgi:hypothetical protein
MFLIKIDSVLLVRGHGSLSSFLSKAASGKKISDQYVADLATSSLKLSHSHDT